MTKKSVILALLIGQTFLWTGSAFISVLYRLYGFFDPAQVTLYTEVLYYAAQAAGIAVHAALLKRRPGLAAGRPWAAACVAGTGLLTAAALLAGNGGAVVVLGLLMNVGIGLLSGVYLTPLAAAVPQQHRGMVFGCSYAIGSVGTWLLSLLMGGTLLRSGAAVWLFLALAAVSVALVRFLEPVKSEDLPDRENVSRSDKGLLLLALSLPLLCSVVNGLGYYFDAADLSGVLDPAFTRLFYAFGLVAAGFVNDRNRRLGAVACVAALVFPFASLALRYEVGIAAALSIFSYIFYGFFSVYRVVLFVDLAGKSKRLLPLAVFGLMAGRLGDAAGTLGGLLLSGSQIALTCVTTAGFIICVLLFFALYHRLYVPNLSEKDHWEAMCNAFEARYGFTSRQAEIFRLAVRGASNAEISAELFLSESTVKFHMKNILTRTGCVNRTELITLFKKDGGVRI